jgi:hypothetical protein
LTSWDALDRAGVVLVGATADRFYPLLFYEEGLSERCPIVPFEVQRLSEDLFTG